MMRKILLLMLVILAVFIAQNQAWSDPFLNLPTGEVTVHLQYTASPSYWKATFTDISGSYSVTNTSYLSWCCDQDGTMATDVWLKVKLYESYDASLTNTYPDTDPMPNLNRGNHGYDVTTYGAWDNVNWIINNKGAYSAGDIQNAIWYFVDGGSGPNALASAAGAAANNGYVGVNRIAVILEPISKKSGSSWVPVTGGEPWGSGGAQYVFIEVPVPEPGTLLLLGTGLVGLAGYAKFRFNHRKKQA